MSQFGVCSWSLAPRDPEELVAGVRASQADAIQLAFDPILRGEWTTSDVKSALKTAGIRVLSGMIQAEGEDYSSLAAIERTGGIAPDETWEANLAMARKAVPLAHEFGVSLVTFHVGFIPEEPQDPRRKIVIDRCRQIGELFAEGDLRLGFETGQESAQTLLEALEEIGLSNVGANFDPANMILYGMGDPIASLRTLIHHVFQIHLKDANPSGQPTEWGDEVPVGQGAVDWPAFFSVLKEHDIQCDLVAEREAGDQRAHDLAGALALARSLVGVSQ